MIRKKLGIAGSTGNVGRQTLEIIDDLRKMGHDYEVSWLGCYGNIKELENQIYKFEPKAVSVIDEEKAAKLERKVGIPVYAGERGLLELVRSEDYDGFVNAVIGSAGIKPTVEAIKSEKDVYLANKETLVAAGSIIMDLAKEYIPDETNPSCTRIVPMDDEPAAIHSLMNGKYTKEDVEKLIITCSGGALWNKSREEIKYAVLEEVLKHPTFVMSPQITVNSGTLMNKGHEVIQAACYFDVPLEKIEVLVHPSSYISSGIRLKDGRNLVEICPSDVKYHIHYALTYPETVKINYEGKKTKGVDLRELDSLKLAGAPDAERFPCFEYALESYRIGGTMPAAVNAANEVAVEYFCNGKIKYVKDIEDAVRHVLYTHKPIRNPTLEEILEVDKKIKEETKRYLEEVNEFSK